nr:MAG TPA: hypothetical protein [Caudoviricetes sp.]DAT21345.1 MAG TPA: hypothetical protein [Caudoviricetes sp.]
MVGWQQFEEVWPGERKAHIFHCINNQQLMLCAEKVTS